MRVLLSLVAATLANGIPASEHQPLRWLASVPNELATPTLTPTTLAIPPTTTTLVTPSLATPTLVSPVLATPTLATPTLATPALVTPPTTLATPTLATPALVKTLEARLAAIETAPQAAALGAAGSSSVAGYPCPEMKPHAHGKLDLGDPFVAPADLAPHMERPCNFGGYFSDRAEAKKNCSSYYYIIDKATDPDTKKMIPCMERPQPDWQGKYGCKPDWDSTFQCPHASSQTCRIDGDPHFTNFDGDHYDHQGHGVYKLYDDLTRELTIQSFQCPSDH